MPPVISPCDVNCRRRTRDSTMSWSAPRPRSRRAAPAPADTGRRACAATPRSDSGRRGGGRHTAHAVAHTRAGPRGQCERGHCPAGYPALGGACGRCRARARGARRRIEREHMGVEPTNDAVRRHPTVLKTAPATGRDVLPGSRQPHVAIRCCGAGYATDQCTREELCWLTLPGHAWRRIRPSAPPSLGRPTGRSLGARRSLSCRWPSCLSSVVATGLGYSVRA